MTECFRNKLLCAWYITAISLLACISVVMFWLLYPYKTLEVYNVNLLTKEVRGNDFLMYELEHCKFTDKQAILSKSFVDGIVYRALPTISNVPPGCGIVTIAVRVPDTLSPGEYYLKADALYKVNPIREIDIQYSTERFKIVH